MKSNNIQKQLALFCVEKGVKLTPLRMQIFDLIYKANKPTTAYELLRNLRKLKENAEPPTVYRVLEFLQSKHLIHRIETSNSYVACLNPSEHLHGQIFLCISCGSTIEVENTKIFEAIRACAKKYRFQLADDLTEIRGRCYHCTS